MSKGTDPATVEDRSIVITRLLDAPRDRVFKAWTNPAEIAR